MPLSANVELVWGDGETHLFALKLAQIAELQRICGAGISTIYNRVFSEEFYLEDIYHTIRLGLIGGGLSPVLASGMMKAYVYDQPIKPIEKEDDPSSPYATACAILAALFVGIEKDDTVGEQVAGTVDSSMSPPSEQ